LRELSDNALCVTKFGFVYVQIDLKQISKTFQKTYGKTLQDFIKGDCSGDYRKLLLAVLGNN